MPKGNMWSSVPLPCCLFEIIVNCCKLFYVSRAAAPKGAMSVLFSFHALNLADLTGGTWGFSGVS